MSYVQNFIKRLNNLNELNNNIVIPKETNGTMNMRVITLNYKKTKEI